MGNSSKSMVMIEPNDQKLPLFFDVSMFGISMMGFSFSSFFGSTNSILSVINATAQKQKIKR